MFPGFASRFEAELRTLYIEKALKNSESKNIKIDIKVVDSPRRKYSVFIGATVVAELYNKEENEAYWITKEEWAECGTDIIFKKCQNVII